uniref:RRM domain-containing protein n=1 Tax=Globodera rostochiensis TaxID=31243 RepID=A0A914HEB5_GLORO
MILSCVNTTSTLLSFGLYFVYFYSFKIKISVAKMFSSNAYGSYGGPGAYSSGYGGLAVASISFETNSKDPFLQRARVFVGNIMTSKVGRDELIQLFSNYGKLLGVTVFKGYAFVQFSYGTEADLAVSALNGYNWHGATLDVKLAMHGQQPMVPPKSILTGNLLGGKGVGKRNKNEVPQQEAAAKDLKRMKIDQGSSSSGSQELLKHNSANKTFAAHMDSIGIVPHGDSEILDTLICGGCRYVTNSLADFVEHRKRPCKFPAKTVGEPDVLGCISCDQQFDSSWALLFHHNTAHIRPLYKAIDASCATGTNGGEQCGGGGGCDEIIKQDLNNESTMMAAGGADHRQQQQQTVATTTSPPNAAKIYTS